MRLPSLGDVATAARDAGGRFPLVIASGLVAAYAGISLVDSVGDETAGVRLLSSAVLGLPLFFALTVTAERRLPRSRDRWLVLGVGLVVLAGLWYLWPQWTQPAQGLHFVQLALAFHLLVAFAPFPGFREPNAFWQYNRLLFVRFLVAALFTGVLWLGLSGALLALDKLFDVDVPAEGYARLWMVLAFLFHPWFFVAGVPRDVGALEERDDFPAVLRVFTQFVLVPIVAIYLLILTLYLGKVVITREWPSGWIGYLVSSVAAAGMLAWLLVHPLERRPEHPWVKPFTRGFFVALMPAIVMLWLAIAKRIAQYGITEPRYFLLVLSVWLAAMAVYYTVSRARRIELIPATLCAVALLTFAGPWGAYSVSRGSQQRRLEATLARNGLLEGGTLRPATRPLPAEDEREISAGFRYLLEVHGPPSVEPWFGDTLRRSVGALGGGSRGRAEAGTRSIARALRVRYVEARASAQAADYFIYFTERRREAVDIGGYSVALRLSAGLVRDSVALGGGAFLSVQDDPVALVVRRGGERVFDVPLGAVIDSAAAYRRRNPVGAIPAALMTVEVSDARGAALVQLTQLGGNRSGSPRVTALEGDVYLRIP